MSAECSSYLEGFLLDPSLMTVVAYPNLIVDINYLNTRTEVGNKEILLVQSGTLM